MGWMRLRVTSSLHFVVLEATEVLMHGMHSSSARTIYFWVSRVLEARLQRCAILVGCVAVPAAALFLFRYCKRYRWYVLGHDVTLDSIANNNPWLVTQRDRHILRCSLSRATASIDTAWKLYSIWRYL